MWSVVTEIYVLINSKSTVCDDGQYIFAMTDG